MVQFIEVINKNTDTKLLIATSVIKVIFKENDGSAFIWFEDSKKGLQDGYYTLDSYDEIRTQILNNKR